ncbi:MAG: ribosomal-processing cysteine protease Prp [Lachnospiraceae bacterium]|nr:ribosomal-processing cysteine protease Prp [Lachnospiraceae bacterium]
MITVKVLKRADDYEGFLVSGHAGYAESGNDIICAAVSALTVNAANSIEILAGDRVEDSVLDGFLSCRFPEGLSDKGKLLMQSMILGLKQIETDYQEPYVKVIISEVQTC